MIQGGNDIKIKTDKVGRASRETNEMMFEIYFGRDEGCLIQQLLEVRSRSFCLNFSPSFIVQEVADWEHVKKEKQ